MKLRITVEGTTYEVDVEVLEGAAPAAAPPASAAPARAARPAPSAAPAAAAPPRPKPGAAPAAGGASECIAPVAGNITKINVSPGDTVAENDVLVVLEAMKMETNVASPAAGTVKQVNVQAGDSVTQGQVLVELE